MLSASSPSERCWSLAPTRDKTSVAGCRGVAATGCDSGGRPVGYSPARRAIGVGGRHQVAKYSNEGGGGALSESSRTRLCGHWHPHKVRRGVQSTEYWMYKVYKVCKVCRGRGGPGVSRPRSRRAPRTLSPHRGRPLPPWSSIAGYPRQVLHPTMPTASHRGRRGHPVQRGSAHFQRPVQSGLLSRIDVPATATATQCQCPPPGALGVLEQGGGGGSQRLHSPPNDINGGRPRRSPLLTGGVWCGCAPAVPSSQRPSTLRSTQPLGGDGPRRHLMLRGAPPQPPPARVGSATWAR